MSKEELLLAALASAKGSSFSPVQIQKLLFLIDRRIGRDIGIRTSFADCGKTVAEYFGVPNNLAGTSFLTWVT